MKILNVKNKNPRLALAGFCFSLLILLGIFLTQAALAFIGPTAPPPSGRGYFIDASGKYLSIGSSSNYYNLYIFAPDSNPAHYSFRVADEILNPILRIRNDLLTIIGTSTIGSGAKYDLYSNTLYSQEYEGTYAFTGYPSCSGVSSLNVCDTTDIGTLVVTASGSSLYSIDPLGYGYGSMIGFRNLGDINTTVLCTMGGSCNVAASNSDPGVFGFYSGGGNFIFPDASRIGVGTSTHLFPSSPTTTLMVFGKSYFASGTSIGIATTTAPPNGFGTLTVSPTGTWATSWKKAIRLEASSFPSDVTGYNGEAIELGGGVVGQNLYGVGARYEPVLDPDLIYQTYTLNFFKVNSGVETGGITSMGRNILAITSSSVTVNAGTIAGSAVVGNSLTVRPSGGFDTLVVGNSSGKSSIKARVDNLFLDSTGATTKKVFLNSTNTTDVILATGGGRVGIGTSTISGIALNVSGTLKATGFKLGTSATPGHVLTATGAADGTGSWSALSGALTGTSTSSYNSYAVKWLNSTTLGDSILYETGGNAGINTLSPQGKLAVNGGVSIGSYAGTNAPPTNGLILSGRLGVNTSTPAAQLQINSSTSATIIIRKTVGVNGSGRIFSAVGADQITTGDAICRQAALGRPNSVCIARFGLDGSVMSCGGINNTNQPQRALCVDFND